jgi:protein-tyrosine phosphatase
MNQITPYSLWIGNDADLRALRTLFDHEIRAVVQLAVEETSTAVPHELILCRFPLLDGAGNDPELLLLAVKTVATLIDHGVPTLVSCGHGMSRSPAIAAAALSLVRQESPQDCLNLVNQCQAIDVSPGFWTEVVAIVQRAK